MDKLNELKYIISRYDTYAHAFNFKGNVYLALNTFILGGVLTAYYKLSQQYNLDGHYFTLLLTFLVSNISTIYLTLMAVRPLHRTFGAIYNSIYFYRYVSKFELKEYQDFVRHLDEETLEENAILQAYKMSKVVDFKFTKLQYATYMIGVQVAWIVLFLSLFLFEKKELIESIN